MDEIGNCERQEVGRNANNRVKNSYLPFRRRERAMLRFRRMKTLQKFASVHANVHNHFNLERHVVDRHTFMQRRPAALAEWQSLASSASALKENNSPAALPNLSARFTWTITDPPELLEVAESRVRQPLVTDQSSASNLMGTIRGSRVII